MPQYKVDMACAESGCPGSALYIYESTGDAFECACAADYTCKTEEEMFAHILEHDRAGQHVRRSLLERAHGREPELTDKWREIYDSFHVKVMR